MDTGVYLRTVQSRFFGSRPRAAGRRAPGPRPRAAGRRAAGSGGAERRRHRAHVHSSASMGSRPARSFWPGTPTGRRDTSQNSCARHNTHHKTHRSRTLPSASRQAITDNLPIWAAADITKSIMPPRRTRRRCALRAGKRQLHSVRRSPSSTGSRCALAPIAYGIRRRVGYENTATRTSSRPLLRCTENSLRLVAW